MRTLFVSTLLLCLANVGWAQFETATVLGTVKDRSDAVIAGVRVTLTNAETGFTATKDTDENGNYEFVNVRVGRYRVTAEKSGFNNAVADNFTVNVNARQRVDLILSVGSVNESVTVSANVSAVEADSSERGQVIETKKIVELPLNGRNYSDLALLSPGVRRSAYAVANPPREGSFNVNGQRSTFNNFLLDGVDNNAYGTSNQGFSNQVINLPPDALTEFRIVTNNMSAEYGRTSGAMINASMRAGTNDFHGTAWEFLRNTDLNAVGFFKPAKGVKPVLQRNQFGATLGGPIVKDRAFFFANYEGFRERNKFLTFSTIPTVAQRQGIFATTITNPLTGRVYPAGIAIPQSDWQPFARKVINDLPLPTNTATANNFERIRSDKNNTDKMDLKLDGRITNNVTAFVRLDHRKTNYFQEPEIPGASGGGGNGYIRILNQQIAFGSTWTIGPSSLLEFRMGISRTQAGKSPRDLGGPNMLETYGIPGLPTDPRVAGGLTNQAVSGYTGFGRQATNPQWQYPTVWDPKVVYSRIIGRHSLKAGYEFQRVHTEVQDVNPLYGADVYSARFSGDNLADFMFGLRAGYGLTNFFIANIRQYLHFGYIQDDFKVNSKLTLNIGMRYEFATPQWERDNKLTNYDPQTNTLLQAKSGSLYDRALVNPDRNNWAPRFGLAYSITPSFVARGGYGISYIHFNRAGGGNLLPINYPQSINVAVAQQPSQSTFRTTQQGYPDNLLNIQGFDQRLANISYIPKDTSTGYVQSWFFSVQKEVVKDLVVDLGYIGNKSSHLIVFADYNQATPASTAAGTGTTLQSRRPIQAWGPITITWPGAVANYNALQFKVEKRYSGGLSLLNSFTWGRAMDTAAQSLEDQGNGGRPSPQNFYNMAGERGPSSYDQKFNDTLSVVYELPVGKGRKYGSSWNRGVDALLGGWQVSGINTSVSGEPINIWYSSVPAGFQVSNIGQDFRGQPTYRPNLLGDPLAPEAERTIDNYFNKNNVVIPTNGPFGNAGRNVARSHGLWQVDLNAQKNFRITERIQTQFRSEFFNLLNHTNFRAATPDRSSGAFGTIRSTYPARQIQFALKVLF